jgi:hypothetical protein
VRFVLVVLIASLGSIAGCTRHSSDRVASTSGPPDAADGQRPVASSTSSAVDASAPANALGRHVYEGTIAGKPVVVRVDCTSADVCSGYYFYKNIGATIRLVYNTSNVLDERVGARTRSSVTGRLAFTGPPGKPTWDGTWTAPVGAPAQPIALTRVARDAAPRWMKRTFAEKSKKDKDCFVTVTSFEILGLADEKMEAAINAAFAPESFGEHTFDPADARADDPDDGCGKGGAQCDDGNHGYRILCRTFDGQRGGLFYQGEAQPTLLDDKLLSVRLGYGFDGGGVHPSDGVSGVTIDVHDGHMLDARDLLTTPAHPPKWSSFVSRAFFKNVEPDFANDVTFEVPVDSKPNRALPGDAPAWTSFYLTPTGIALVPNVPEVIRQLRQEVQVVPFAKVRSSLLASGRASHLYTSAPGSSK